MQDIFLVHWGKPLLLLHALVSILLIGSSTHHFLLVKNYLKGNFAKVGLEKLYVKVGAISYLLTFALGALIYPNYRYHVRQKYFDLEMPWASNLFDIKEHWGALGLALYFVLLIYSLTMDPEKEKEHLLFYVIVSGLCALIIWFNLISGLLLTSYRSV